MGLGGGGGGGGGGGEQRFCYLTLLVYFESLRNTTVKILKFGTPQTIAIIVLKIEKFDVTLL